MSGFVLAGSQPRSPFTPRRVLAAACAALLVFLLVVAAVRPGHRDQLVAGLTTAMGSLRPKTPAAAVPLPPCNATAAPTPPPVVPEHAPSQQPAAPTDTAAVPEPAAGSNTTRLAGGAVPQLPQVTMCRLPTCCACMQPMVASKDRHTVTYLRPPPAPPCPQYKPAIVQRMWQYTPFLSQRSLRRGLYSIGDPARMRRFVHKLLSGALSNVSGVLRLIGCQHLARLSTHQLAALPTGCTLYAAAAAQHGCGCTLALPRCSSRRLGADAACSWLNSSLLAAPAGAAGDPISVSTLGGSVTAGQGALHGASSCTAVALRSCWGWCVAPGHAGGAVQAWRRTLCYCCCRLVPV